MDAIVAESVAKRYRKHRRKRFLTLKSTLIDLLTKRNSEEKATFWALNDVSFALKRGEMLGIIGRNGSGKSTLLKVIAGITKPTSGKITVNGRLSALIELGGGFHPEISGRENIMINGIILGLSRKQLLDKMDDIIKFSGLGDFIDAPVRTYSSGMFIRLGFSIAIHVDPEILLIDEILAVGDAKFGHKCIDKIEEYKNKDKTILFVSHDLSAVEKFCDRAIWLEKGRILAEGHPREIIDRYLTYIEREESELFAEEHARITSDLDAHHQEMENGEIANLDPQASHEKAKDRKRWGNRDVEITSVKFMDRNGMDKYVFNTGESMTIKIAFRAKEIIEKPVFGIGIYLPNGTCVYASNTDIEFLEIEHIHGEGEVRCSIPSLDLIESSYYLDVACHKRDGFPYDYHFRLHTFAVRSRFHNEQGIYRPDHEWSIHSNDHDPVVLKVKT